jgi:hypothetical protein
MRDFRTDPSCVTHPRSGGRPFGWFVHHQGRGHAERCAAIVNALPARRAVTIFCARSDIFPPLRPGVAIREIPSLFEAPGIAAGELDTVATPETMHCAPLGWPTIREATRRICTWFAEADPELMVCDVSAEIAQLARLCSVPHVKVLQHGDRNDPGHRAAYDGAAGLIAPFHERLAQPDWPEAMRAKTRFAPGVGVELGVPSRRAARARLGLDPDVPVAVALSGGGGQGLPTAPFGIAARTFPQMRWILLGAVREDWHATLPANLTAAGWVDTAADHIAAADLVVASTGNTTTHRILASGRPWIAVPEWRYFDEQVEKARALARAGAAHVLPDLPSSAHRWRSAVEQAMARHDPARQRALVAPDAARGAADWLEELAARLWRPFAAPAGPPSRLNETPASEPTCLTCPSPTSPS